MKLTCQKYRCHLHANTFVPRVPLSSFLQMGAMLQKVAMAGETCLLFPLFSARLATITALSLNSTFVALGTKVGKLMGKTHAVGLRLGNTQEWSGQSSNHLSPRSVFLLLLVICSHVLLEFEMD